MNILSLPDDILIDQIKYQEKQKIATIYLNKNNFNCNLKILNHILDSSTCQQIQQYILSHLQKNKDYLSGCVWSGKYYDYNIISYDSTSQNILYLVLPINNYQQVIQKILSLLQQKDFIIDYNQKYYQSYNLDYFDIYAIKLYYFNFETLVKSLC